MKIPRGSIWVTSSGYKLLVINTAKHADDCTVEFVYFSNITSTFDSTVGDKWVMEKEAFLSRYKQVKENENA